MAASLPKGEEWVQETALEAVTPPAKSLGRCLLLLLLLWFCNGSLHPPLLQVGAWCEIMRVHIYFFNFKTIFTSIS